jgi:HEAT repeat protein
MSDDPTSGREPALPTGSDMTGREPFIGGEDSLVRALLDFDEESALSNEALVARLAGALPQLISLLQDDDLRRRYAATRVIAMLAVAHPQSRRQTVPVLVDLLEDALHSYDYLTPRLLIERLGDTADPRAADALVRLLLGGGTPYSLTAVTRDALVRLGTVALPPLMAAAAEDVGDSRIRVMRAFEALTRICRADPSTVPQLAGWITPLVLNRQVGLDIHEVRVFLGVVRPREVLDALLRTAADRSAGDLYRIQAVGTLSRFRDPRVTTLLFDLLTGHQVFLRTPAARALIYARRRSDAPRIVALLEHDDPQIRRLAMIVASRRRLRGAIPAIREMLSDNEMPVRRDAVVALARYRDPDAFDALASALSDGHSEVRRKAVIALGRAHDHRAVSLLLPLLRDRAKIVRKAAVDTLWALRREFPDYADVINREVTQAVGEGLVS